jgi:signal transduction histidine kinase
MEGSPVRGQRKPPIMPLNECSGVEEFQAEFVRLARQEFKHAQVFFGLVDADSKTSRLPAWIKVHLQRHPGLQQKLEHGEMAGISAVDENPGMLRPVATTRSSIVLIPMMSDGTLSAVIGLVSPLDEPPLSAEDLETARQLAYEAAPILARLLEIDRLRRDNTELLAKSQIADRAEEDIAALVDSRNALDAILQMRSHQQVNVAHELRTPLAAIRGYVRMILDGRGGEITEKQRDYLRIVTDNTNRLIALVGWMSYVAELSAQHFRLSRFDFRDIWNECARRSEPKLTAKNLKLKQQIADESFVMIGDREKLASVLDELVGLAARLAEERGTITVELTHGREREVSFKLAETGGEIPTDVLGRIFDRSFNAIVKPPAQSAQSSGMSLSGVYDVVGMHGGRVFVNSSAGQGAAFLFTLPAVISGGEETNHEQAVNSGRRRR